MRGERENNLTGNWTQTAESLFAWFVFFSQNFHWRLVFDMFWMFYQRETPQNDSKTKEDFVYFFPRSKLRSVQGQRWCDFGCNNGHFFSWVPESEFHTYNNDKNTEHRIRLFCLARPQRVCVRYPDGLFYSGFPCWKTSLFRIQNKLLTTGFLSKYRMCTFCSICCH